jgi:hypothetical protein
VGFPVRRSAKIAHRAASGDPARWSQIPRSCTAAIGVTPDGGSGNLT